MQINVPTRMEVKNDYLCTVLGSYHDSTAGSMDYQQGLKRKPLSMEINRGKRND